jgi:hypothetical protein
MTVALYPTTIAPLIGYQVEPIYTTQITPLKSGADVAEKVYDYPRYRIMLPYRVSASNLATLQNFYHARRGRYEAFDYRDPFTSFWEDIYVGTGDGSTTVFDIPIYNIDAPLTPGDWVLYKDGVVQSTGFTFSHQAGENDRSQVTFTVAPTSGEVITFDGSQYRMFRVRFASDTSPYKTVSAFSGGIEMFDLSMTLISQVAT